MKFKVYKLDKKGNKIKIDNVYLNEDGYFCQVSLYSYSECDCEFSSLDVDILRQEDGYIFEIE